MENQQMTPEPNPPAGDTTDRPFSDEEIRALIGGAELLRYAEGTEEHAGNIMAVFETPDGRGIGLTMSDDSKTPESVIGETVRESDEIPFKRGSGVGYGKAFILFSDVNPVHEKIIVRNTASLGVYEVEI